MIIVSDIHFGKEDSSCIELLLNQLKYDEDRLLITPGDLTQLAGEEAYSIANKFLDEVFKMGIRVVATPGNHDFGGSWKGERYIFRFELFEYRFLIDMKIESGL